PLEWMAMEGLRRYGGVELANKARDRWLALNRRTYRATGRMMGKYDVVDLTRRAGGGGKALQGGFWWRDGVARALSAEKRAAERAPRDTTRRSGATTGKTTRPQKTTKR